MKQAIILFTENISKGYSNPRLKRISMYIDMDRQSLEFNDLLTRSDSASFKSRRHKHFGKLRQALEQWEATGIEATIQKQFSSLLEWDVWRKTVGFKDCDVHWQVFVQQDDNSWALYLELGLSFPRELEEIYRIASRMKRP